MGLNGEELMAFEKDKGVFFVYAYDFYHSFSSRIPLHGLLETNHRHAVKTKAPYAVFDRLSSHKDKNIRYAAIRRMPREIIDKEKGLLLPVFLYQARYPLTLSYIIIHQHGASCDSATGNRRAIRTDWHASKPQCVPDARGSADRSTAQRQNAIEAGGRDAE